MAPAPPVSLTEMGSVLAEMGTVPSYTGPAAGAVPGSLVHRNLTQGTRGEQRRFLSSINSTVLLLPSTMSCCMDPTTPGRALSTLPSPPLLPFTAGQSRETGEGTRARLAGGSFCSGPPVFRANLAQENITSNKHVRGLFSASSLSNVYLHGNVVGDPCLENASLK